MIRLLVAAGLALAAAGCASGGRAGLVGELPPTVAPAASPSESSAVPVAADPRPAAPVPAAALLAPVDLGAGWTRSEPAPVACATGLPTEPSRSTGLKDSRGTLTETISTGADVATAVASWRRALARCGFSVRALALGDAGVSARSADGSARVVVTGTEGVVVVLHARDALAAATEDMDGWADLALGTSCVAAPDGCH